MFRKTKHGDHLKQPRFRYNPFQDAHANGMQIIATPLGEEDFREALNQTILLDCNLNDSRAAELMTLAMMLLGSNRERAYQDLDQEVLHRLYGQDLLQELTVDTSCAREVQRRSLALTGTAPTRWKAFGSITGFRPTALAQSCLSAPEVCTHGFKGPEKWEIATSDWLEYAHVVMRDAEPAGLK